MFCQRSIDASVNILSDCQCPSWWLSLSWRDQHRRVTPQSCVNIVSIIIRIETSQIQKILLFVSKTTGIKVYIYNFMLFSLNMEVTCRWITFLVHVVSNVADYQMFTKNEIFLNRTRQRRIEYWCNWDLAFYTSFKIQKSRTVKE